MPRSIESRRVLKSTLIGKLNFPYLPTGNSPAPITLVSFLFLFIAFPFICKSMLHHHTAYRQSPTSIRHRRCKEVIHQLADSHSGPHMACRHGSCCPPWSRQDVLPRFPPTPQFRFPFELKLLIHANKIHLLLTGMDTTASPCAAALSTPPRACHAATMDTFPLSDCSPRCRFLAAAAPSKGLSAASPPLLPWQASALAPRRMTPPSLPPQAPITPPATTAPQPPPGSRPSRFPWMSIPAAGTPNSLCPT